MNSGFYVIELPFAIQVAQEIIIKDGTITHIGAGPYNGFLQGFRAIAYVVK